MLYIKNISKLNLRNIFFQMWADQKFIWLGVWFVFSNVSKGETSVTHFHFIQTDKLREFITSQSKLFQHFSPKFTHFLFLVLGVT